MNKQKHLNLEARFQIEVELNNPPTGKLIYSVAEPFYFNKQHDFRLFIFIIFSFQSFRYHSDIAYIYIIVEILYQLLYSHFICSLLMCYHNFFPIIIISNDRPHLS